MPDLEFIQAEIERMRTQMGRQRREILQLQRAGIPTAAAETLLRRMPDKIGFAHPANKLREEQPHPLKGKVRGAG